MSATDELRRLLDERGVEYYDGTKSTLWLKDEHGYRASADELASGLMSVHIWCDTPAQAVEATLGPTVTGETSDGYHTFNELYHHRAVLFSVIVRDHPELAWKSRLHSDGTMYDGMFIVGIETPQGQATYHYDIDPYWGMFDCVELDRAPEWDGHSSDEAIARIATLGVSDASVTRQGGAGTCYPVPIYGFDGEFTEYDCDACSACGAEWDGDMPNFCPNCGAEVVTS